MINKCGANVLALSRFNAWDFVGTDDDTPTHAAVGMDEWLMFSKTVMPVLPGGKAKHKRNDNVLATAATRWAEGERHTLWDEALRRCATRPTRKRSVQEKDRERELQNKRQQVVQLA